jgi:hypothetical protein
LVSPFIKTTLTLGNLLGDDTTFCENEDSLLIYYYQTDSLIYVNSDSLINFSDTITNTNISLGSVKLLDFVLEGSFSMQEILTHIEPDVADTLIEHNGDEYIFPPFQLLSPFTIDMSPVSEYVSITFSGGFLTVKISNDLPVTLYDIEYEVFDVVNNIVIDVFSVNKLTSNETATDTIWLADKTLSNTFSFKVNVASSSGSYPDSVLIDLSQGLNFHLESNQLKVINGSAIIYEQINYSDETFVNINFDEAKIKKVKFEKGLLNFSFENNFNIGVKAILSLTSSQVEGEIPQHEFLLPAFENYSGYWDLTNMEIDLTKNPDQPYNSFPVFLEIRLETTDGIVEFDSSQKVNISFNTDNVTLGYAEGNIGKQTQAIEEDSIKIDLSILNNIEGDVFFNEAELSLKYLNGFGIPLVFHTDFVGKNTNTNNTMKLDIDSIIIDYPVVPGETVNNNVVLNNGNSNIPDFLNFRPDILYYKGDILTNWNNDTINFVTSNSVLLANSELKIPMVFYTSSLIFKDTADFSTGNTEITIGEGRFFFDVLNGFPFSMQLNLQIPDSITGDILETIELDEIPAAQTGDDGKVIVPTKKLVTADFDDNFRTPDPL